MIYHRILPTWNTLKSKPMTIAGAAFTDLIGGDLRAYKTADESVSSTTLQDDDHLSVTVIAGKVYRFRCFVMVAAAGSVEGIKLALGGTCTATTVKAAVSIFDGVAGSTALLGRISALGSGTGVALSIGNSFASVEGSIEVNAGGTFLLSWAQFAGLGLSATTVQRGSSLVMERMT